MLACFDLYQLPVNVLWFSDRVKAVSLMIGLDLLFLLYVTVVKTVTWEGAVCCFDEVLGFSYKFWMDSLE